MLRVFIGCLKHQSIVVCVQVEGHWDLLKISAVLRPDMTSLLWSLIGACVPHTHT